MHCHKLPSPTVLSSLYKKHQPPAYSLISIMMFFFSINTISITAFSTPSIKISTPSYSPRTLQRQPRPHLPGYPPQSSSFTKIFSIQTTSHLQSRLFYQRKSASAMNETVPLKVLSVTLLLLSTLPLLRLLHPHLPSPSLYLLLPLLDHISCAIFAARYLTFLTGYPPYSPRNIYPFLLPYAPLFQLSHSLFNSTTSIKHTILAHTGAPAPSYNRCQAKFTIFISTNAVLILSVLQVMYGVPHGVSHYLGLVLPALVVVLREGCSLFTVAWIALFAKFGNVASLTYLIITAVHALREGVSLERLLLAPKGDLPDYICEKEGEGSPLLRKGEVSDISEGTEVDDGIEIVNDGAAKM